MRLKFGRLINLKLFGSNSVTVPNDEIWRVSMYMNPLNVVNIEDNSLDYSPNVQTGFVSAGTKISAYKGAPGIKGIAFKVVKEE